MKLREFNVGDKVCEASWNEGRYVEILYKGKNNAFVVNVDGYENAWGLDDEYIRYTPLKKKVKMWKWLTHDTYRGYSSTVYYYTEAGVRKELPNVDIICKLDYTEIEEEE